MIKKSYKVSNPCAEKWEDMEDIPVGKFCGICSRDVIDFTEKTGDEIESILKRHEAGSVCGRIWRYRIPFMAAGIMLVTNLESAKAQSVVHQGSEISVFEKDDSIRFSGVVLNSSDKKPVSAARVYFVHLKKLLKAITDENGAFTMMIPSDLINNENILYISFEASDTGKSAMKSGNQTFLLSGKDLTENKIYDLSSEKYIEIGAVVVTIPSLSDYYYFNGKNIRRRKFEKLRKENPGNQYFFFEGREAEVISGKKTVGNLYLLFSN